MRNKCDQFFCCALHGVLGRGVRVELQQCVIDHVRNGLPNTNKNTCTWALEKNEKIDSYLCICCLNG